LRHALPRCLAALSRCSGATERAAAQGTSRGGADIKEIVKRIDMWAIDMVFVVGGNGGNAGAQVRPALQPADGRACRAPGRAVHAACACAGPRRGPVLPRRRRALRLAARVSEPQSLTPRLPRRPSSQSARGPASSARSWASQSPSTTTSCWRAPAPCALSCLSQAWRAWRALSPGMRLRVP